MWRVKIQSLTLPLWPKWWTFSLILWHLKIAHSHSTSSLSEHWHRLHGSPKRPTRILRQHNRKSTLDICKVGESCPNWWSKRQQGAHQAYQNKHLSKTHFSFDYHFKTACFLAANHSQAIYWIKNGVAPLTKARPAGSVIFSTNSRQNCFDNKRWFELVARSLSVFFASSKSSANHQDRFWPIRFIIGCKPLVTWW